MSPKGPPARSVLKQENDFHVNAARIRVGRCPKRFLRGIADPRVKGCHYRAHNGLLVLVGGSDGTPAVEMPGTNVTSLLN